MSIDDALTDALLLAGAACVAYGLSLMALPLVYVWVGALLLAGGLLRLR